MQKGFGRSIIDHGNKFNYRVVLMPEHAANDFDFIRARLEELKKEKEEADKMTIEVESPPVPYPAELGDMFCADAFKMENLSIQHYCHVHDEYFAASEGYCPSCRISGISYIQREAWKV